MFRQKMILVVVVFVALGCAPFAQFGATRPKHAVPEDILTSAYGNSLAACMPSKNGVTTPSRDILLRSEWRSLPTTIKLTNGGEIEFTQDESLNGLTLKGHFVAPGVEPKDEFIRVFDGLQPPASFTGKNANGVVVDYRPFYLFVCGPTIFIDFAHAQENIIAPGRIPPPHSS